MSKGFSVFLRMARFNSFEMASNLVLSILILSRTSFTLCYPVRSCAFLFDTSSFSKLFLKVSTNLLCESVSAGLCCISCLNCCHSWLMRSS